MAEDDLAGPDGDDLVELVAAPEFAISMYEESLKANGIPFVRVPGLAGYPGMGPPISLRVPRRHREDAWQLIALGPGGTAPPPLGEREVGRTAKESRAAREVAEKGDVGRAVTMTRDHLLDHPDDLNAWVSLVGFALLTGDQTDVEKVLREAVEANPDSVTLRTQLAESLEIQRKSEDAEVIYRDLVRQHAGAPQGYLGLAWEALRHQRHDEATELAEQALERLDPVYQPRSTSRLANLYLQLGNRQLAITLLDELVNWFQDRDAAALVAVLRKGDETQDEEAVTEALDLARQLWRDSPDQLEAELERYERRFGESGIGRGI